MNSDNYKFSKYFSMYGETRWANKEEIASMTQPVVLSDDKYDNAGLPVLNDGKVAYVENLDGHSIIFGSTGSKKTRLFCMPTLNLIIGAGESFVATDPKGELYAKTSGMAKQNGYDVVVLNYRDLTLGDTWNPLDLPYKLYKSGDKEGAISRLNDFVNAISEKQMTTTNDIFWVNAARSVALSILMLMLDCCTLEECNLKTFTMFCTEFAKGTSDEVTAKAMGLSMDDLTQNYLKNIMELADKDSIARLNYDGIAGSSDRARGDVQSVLFTLIGVFMTQEALVENMCSNSFDLMNIGNKKTALYLIVPDERTNYHFIATTFIKQCYESLVIKAQSENGLKLPVRVNFMLDEFANIPAIPDMPSMISAARSRNIRFFLVLQSMHQIKQKYRDEAHTIKGNCENWVFLSSKEIELLQEISNLCGNIYIHEGSEIRKQPLISISQLQRLDKERGEALIFCGRQYPFITEMADIDDCEFKTYAPVQMAKVKISDSNSVDPETMYKEMKRGNRHYPFKKGSTTNAKGKEIEVIDSKDREIVSKLNVSQETVNFYSTIKCDNISALTYYNVLENDEGSICIWADEDDHVAAYYPALIYGGGDHAILVNEGSSVVICDHININVREKMKKAEEVLFVFDDSEYGDLDLPEDRVEYWAKVVVRDDADDIANMLASYADISL